jgi:hypothetical protein
MAQFIISEPSKDMAKKPKKPSDEIDQTLLQELIEEGLRIQPRFKPEPIYSKTGKGYMKPSGVDEIAEAKLRLRNKG